MSEQDRQSGSDRFWCGKETDLDRWLARMYVERSLRDLPTTIHVDRKAKDNPGVRAFLGLPNLSEER